MMPENESDKYFALLRRTLSGSIGKNLIDITFKTSQVADSPEHKLLMDLRKCRLADEELLQEFYQKVIQSVSMEENYLIPSAEMVEELIPGGLEGIHGQVCYSEYKSLQ